jgi:DNA-binding NtrC family response regulator
MPKKIIVIDDEVSILAVVEAMLIRDNYEVHIFDNPIDGIEQYKKIHADLLITDIRMEPVDGIHILKSVREINPQAIVILITAYANAQDALQAMKIGAYDYIQKPFKMEKLRSLVRRALTVSEVIEETNPPSSLQDEAHFYGIVSKNPVMQKLFELVKKAAPSKTTILLQGESGTGKELFAKALHNHSGRGKEPFVAINCGALPENLLESELFGHVKGAFTGAADNKEGLLKVAREGTLFLDEIATLTLPLQAKLLRALQEKEIRPVGGLKTEKVHCRIIAATNVSLEKMMEAKTFREDLYYRLSIIPIELPPLRERPEDILILAQHFLKKFAGARSLHFSPLSLNLLMEYHWPGNVRELENTLEHITTLCSDGAVMPTDLPVFLRKNLDILKLDTDNGVMPLKQFQTIAEGQYLLSVLKKFGQNKEVVAKHLDIDVATLKRKLEKFEKMQTS